MSRVDDIYPSDKITLREVGLRDGLQLVQNFPSTAAKRDWITREAAAGVRHFEVGSFLPATQFPQFADVRELIELIDGLKEQYSAALAMNPRGIADAIATPVDEILNVVSATEEHSQANIRRSRAEAIDLVRQTAQAADAAPNRPIVTAAISMAFGCSIAGEVAPTEVLRLAEKCYAAGADIVGIADTVGFAGPRQVGLLTRAMNDTFGGNAFSVHLHDTRGMGIANASAALDEGARILDASLGGLGGCPFAPGATGNIVFEDLVYLCETKGFPTGVDLEALSAVRTIPVEEMPNEVYHGALAKAGPPPNVAWRA